MFLSKSDILKKLFSSLGARSELLSRYAQIDLKASPSLLEWRINVDVWDRVVDVA